MTTALRLTPAMRDQLKQRAGDLGVSVNQLVVGTLAEYLEAGPTKRRPMTKGSGS
ncbi:MAG: hypothetical protein ACRDVW_03275 [Acidimicrobiales bacterium]